MEVIYGIMVSVGGGVVLATHGGAPAVMFRKMMAKLKLGTLVSCPYCISFWLAVAWSLFYVDSVMEALAVIWGSEAYIWSIYTLAYTCLKHQQPMQAQKDMKENDNGCR